MRTGGHGNDALMILMTVGVAFVIGVIVFGGPNEALDAIRELLGDVAGLAREAIGSLLT